jgi:uncharacterized protein (DUF169 family)
MKAGPHLPAASAPQRNSFALSIRSISFLFAYNSPRITPGDVHLMPDTRIDYRELENHFVQSLGLRTRPVAVKFESSLPSGIPKFTGTEPSGCSFWRLAAAGRTFYTVASDHFNCPVGSYTHNIALPFERANELDQTFGLMVQVGYLKMEEVPGIPQLPQQPAAVIYAPLADTPVDPDVVILSGAPNKIMLVQEAAGRAGRASNMPLLGRPTCMALPASMAHGAVMSTGCIGNRIYTGLPDSEMYVAIPGRDLAAIAAELPATVHANSQLATYHIGRRAQLSTE